MSETPLVEKITSALISETPTNQILSDTYPLSTTQFNELLLAVTSELVHRPKLALTLAELLELFAKRDFATFEYIRVIGTKGKVFLGLRDYQKAFICFETAAMFFEEEEDWYRTSAMQLDQIYTLLMQEKYESGIQLAVETRQKIAKAGEDAVFLLGNLETNLGLINRRMGRYQEAIEAYDHAHLAYDSIGHTLGAAISLMNRAHLHTVTNQFADSETALNQARAIFETLDNQIELARVDMNLGTLAAQRSQYRLALQKLENAHKRFEDTGQLYEASFVDWHRSAIYLKLNLWEEAVHSAQSAEPGLRKEQKTAEIATLLVNRALALHRLKIDKQPDQLLEQARRLLRRLNNNTELWTVDAIRASIAFEQNQIQRTKRIATRLSKAVDAAFHPRLKTQLHLLLAQCAFSLGQNADALEHLKDAFVLVEQYQFWEEGIEVNSLMGDFHLKQGDAEQTAVYLTKAIEAIDFYRYALSHDEFQSAFTDDKLRPYQLLIENYHQQLDRPDHLLHIVDVINRMQVWPQSNQWDQTEETAVLQQEETQLLDSWHWLNNKLSENDAFTSKGAGVDSQHLIDEQKAVEQKLLAVRRRKQAFVVETDTPDATRDLAIKIQQRLKQDERFILYYEVADSYHAIVLLSTEMMHQPDLVKTAVLARLNQVWRLHIEDVEEIDDNDQRITQRYLASLYNKLIRPLTSHLEDCTQIYVSLPTAWQDLPLAAAYDGAQYLAERVAITYVPTPERLLQQTPLPPHQNVLLVGCSDNGRLPYVAEEIAQIETQLQALTPTVLLEEAATIQATQLAIQSATLIHFAAHVESRKDNPIFSTIHLYERPLTFSELSGMQIEGSPLVVFSACDTAVGAIKGSAVLNLGRAMLQAGAGHMIVTQWPLEDRAASDLMRSFYQHLTTEFRNVAKALQQAQSEAIKNGRHPFYWAGYSYSIG